MQAHSGTRAVFAVPPRELLFASIARRGQLGVPLAEQLRWRQLE